MKRVNTLQVLQDRYTSFRNPKRPGNGGLPLRATPTESSLIGQAASYGAQQPEQAPFSPLTPAGLRAGGTSGVCGGGSSRLRLGFENGHGFSTSCQVPAAVWVCNCMYDVGLRRLRVSPLASPALIYPHPADLQQRAAEWG